MVTKVLEKSLIVHQNSNRTLFALKEKEAMEEVRLGNGCERYQKTSLGRTKLHNLTTLLQPIMQTFAINHVPKVAAKYYQARKVMLHDFF